MANNIGAALRRQTTETPKPDETPKSVGSSLRAKRASQTTMTMDQLPYTLGDGGRETVRVLRGEGADPKLGQKPDDEIPTSVVLVDRRPTLIPDASADPKVFGVTKLQQAGRTAASAGEGFLTGFQFGLRDEIAGGVNALNNVFFGNDLRGGESTGERFKQGYSTGRKQMLEKQAAHSAANPLAYFGGEFASVTPSLFTTGLAKAGVATASQVLGKAGIGKAGREAEKKVAGELDDQIVKDTAEQTIEEGGIHLADEVDVPSAYELPTRAAQVKLAGDKARKAAARDTGFGNVNALFRLNSAGRSTVKTSVKRAIGYNAAGGAAYGFFDPKAPIDELNFPSSLFDRSVGAVKFGAVGGVLGGVIGGAYTVGSKALSNLKKGKAFTLDQITDVKAAAYQNLDKARVNIMSADEVQLSIVGAQARAVQIEKAFNRKLDTYKLPDDYLKFLEGWGKNLDSKGEIVPDSGQGWDHTFLTSLRRETFDSGHYEEGKSNKMNHIVLKIYEQVLADFTAAQDRISTGVNGAFLTGSALNKFGIDIALENNWLAKSSEDAGDSTRLGVDFDQYMRLLTSVDFDGDEFRSFEEMTQLLRHTHKESVKGTNERIYLNKLRAKVEPYYAALYFERKDANRLTEFDLKPAKGYDYDVDGNTLPTIAELDAQKAGTDVSGVLGRLSSFLPNSKKAKPLQPGQAGTRIGRPVSRKELYDSDLAKQAAAANSIQWRVQTLHDTLDAKLLKQASSGNFNTDKAIRETLVSVITDNPRFFTKEQRESALKIVNGNEFPNMMRKIGSAVPSGRGGILAGIVAVTVFHNPYFLGAVALASGARQFGDIATRRDFQDFVRDVSKGVESSTRGVNVNVTKAASRASITGTAATQNALAVEQYPDEETLNNVLDFKGFSRNRLAE